MSGANSALLRRRISDVRRAMNVAATEHEALRLGARPVPGRRRRDPKHIVGRWALPSGQAFTVRYVDEEKGLALCGGGGRRWYSTVADLHVMLDRQQLRYLGRGR